MDESVLVDLRRSLYRRAPVICAGLETPCRFAVAVVVFRDQARSDAANPKMRGYFAYSGNGKIEMVSPAQGRSRGLSYRDGLMIAAHEYTHLALNEVNPHLVDWLQEGAAVYFGPREGRQVYDRACLRVRDRPLPPIQELTMHYDSVAAAVLLAYTLVSSRPVLNLRPDSGDDEPLPVHVWCAECVSEGEERGE